MNRRRILFVHTDRNRLERLGEALGGEFEALTASSWEVAWPLLSRHMVEMVVVEGAGGVERLRELERRAPRVMRVLLVNEHARNELAQAAEEGHLFVALPEAEEPRSLVRQIRALFSPRTGQRHWTEGDVTVQIGDTRRSPAPRYPVLDISSRGLAFFLASGERMEPLLVGAPLSNLSIWRGEQELLAGGRGVVRHLEPVILGWRGGPHAGEGALDTLASSEELREGCRVGVEFMRSVRRGVPGGREVIRDLLPRIALLREAFQTGKGRAELADDPEIAFVVQGGEVDPLLELVLLEGDRTAPFPLGAVIQASFELGGTTYSFLSSVLPESAWQLPRTARRRGARVLVLKLPGTLRVGRRRRPARFQPSPQQGLEVDLASVLGEATVRRPVLDIGCTGLAFAASDRDVLPVGTVIPRLEISLPTGTRLRTAGRVANLVPLVHGRADGPWRLRCGIQFEGISPGERARLVEIILRAGFPGLSDAQGTPFRDIWAFLQEVGFLYPEKLRRIAPLLPEIERTMSTLLERPNHLFKTLLYRRQQAILGHVSMVRAYCNTWIIQHLAATKSEIGRLAAARLLVLGIAEHADRDPEVEWVRIYFRPDNKWPARVFGRFARQVFAPEISDLRTYSYLTAPAGGTVAAPPGVELRPPTPAERVELEEHLVFAERPIMVRAGDLCRDTLTLDTLSASYRELGLERRREVLVAARGGRLLGFALLEVASMGLNFSELTNAFTVHLVEQEPEVLTLLAARARQRYAELGRGWCIALAGEQDLPHLHAAGFSWSKDYCCWTMHRSLYRRFYEYLHHLYQRSRAVQ